MAHKENRPSQLNRQTGSALSVSKPFPSGTNRQENRQPHDHEEVVFGTVAAEDNRANGHTVPQRACKAGKINKSMDAPLVQVKRERMVDCRIPVFAFILDSQPPTLRAWLATVDADRKAMKKQRGTEGQQAKLESSIKIPETPVECDDRPSSSGEVTPCDDLDRSSDKLANFQDVSNAEKMSLKEHQPANKRASRRCVSKAARKSKRAKRRSMLSNLTKYLVSFPAEAFAGRTRISSATSSSTTSSGLTSPVRREHFQRQQCWLNKLSGHTRQTPSVQLARATHCQDVKLTSSQTSVSLLKRKRVGSPMSSMSFSSVAAAAPLGGG